MQDSATIDRPWAVSKTQVAIGVTDDVSVVACVSPHSAEATPSRERAVFITAGAGKSSG